MKNLITKLIITLVATMLSLSVFAQTSDTDQTGTDCLALGSRVKYEVKLNGGMVNGRYQFNRYDWFIKSVEPTGEKDADASCFTVTPSPTANILELTWNKVGVYKIILNEKAPTGTCKARVNVIQVQVIKNIDKNTFNIELSNAEFCAEDLSTQTLKINLVAGTNQDIAYPVVLRYTIDGIPGESEEWFTASEVQKDLTEDLTKDETQIAPRFIPKGIGNEIIKLRVISMKDKYGANVTGAEFTTITIHRHPVQSVIKHD